jgi:CubicO group peptidase (beta-lactamase class C family)
MNLNLLDQFFTKGVEEDNELSGCVSIVYHKGKEVYHKAFGYADYENDVPMSTDTIFRGASISKLMAGIAIAILVEQGQIALQQPVSSIIPEFSNLKVLSDEPNEEGDYEEVPLRSEMKIGQLLTHRSGLSYRLGTILYLNDPKVAYLHTKYEEAGVFDLPFAEDHTSDEFIRRLASVPLLFQPDEQYHYSLGCDVASIIVERVTGQRFVDFLSEHVFEPLGMSSTSFSAACEEDLVSNGRVAKIYRSRILPSQTCYPFEEEDQNDGKRHHPTLVPYDTSSHHDMYTFIFHPTLSYLPSHSALHQSGGGGILTTAKDYATMLLSLVASERASSGGKEEEGEQSIPTIVAPSTASLIMSSATSDPESSRNKGHPMGPGWGFGLGSAVVLDRGVSSRVYSNNTFLWGGIFGLSYFIDREKDIVAVFCSQKFPNKIFGTREKFHQVVYAALNV